MPLPTSTSHGPFQAQPAARDAAYPYGPQVKFTADSIPPPSAIYVGPDDTIQVWIRNPTVAVSVKIFYRLLLPTGEVVANAEQFTSGINATTPNVKVIQPNEGFLLSMTLYADCISRGQCFARVFLTRGTATSNVPLDHLLIQGYLSEDDRLGFPQSPTESSLNGRGWSRDVTVAAPAAGQPSLTAVPAGVHWAIRGIRIPFLASAAVANRLLTATIADPTGHVAAFQQLSTYITAGQAWVAAWAYGLSFGALAPLASAGFPADLLISAGWVISLDAQALDVADAFGPAVICVEEWIGR